MRHTHKLVLASFVLAMASAAASAAIVVVDGGGPYDITSDTLFTGIVQSSADGAGSYSIDFFTPGDPTNAVADAAVTAATVNSSFTNLTMSWIDGLNLNTLVSAEGIDTLSTLFNGAFPAQSLLFEWTDSDALAGFRFDVEASVAAVPIPAGLLLLGSGGAALGLLGWRRRDKRVTV
ncbi:hypothetical protein BV509_11265 [Rhodovulum sulfidophilum]|uniref:Secreted protein n=1 Tax=Rhodovulum visakhapatnamense TaxID=364297 RepID=A0ABS1RLR5_9RHOB|nr:hypothetical protein [Rhodovulum visakhapatnamense]MBL3571939.1 hypothetical protein [Rhodovulum visakhapatnamense]MBL3580584.1 hypothetical protein [Rhodovulum visakhapatnamense]OLS44857.1 hypothetical protein BV509_11265 [Rhodovulum sulfidophilum]